MSVRHLVPLGAALALSACVVAPAPVVAVPGYGKSAAGFEGDETSCRREGSQAAYANAQDQAGAPAIGTRAGNEAAWQRYDERYAECMSVRGDSVQAAQDQGYGYGYPYGGYGYPYGYAGYGYPYGAYGYPYGFGFGYPFGGFYGGVYNGFGYGGFGRFGYGGYGRFGYGGGFRGGFGGGFHGGFGGGFHGGFGGGFHGGGRR